MFLIPLSLDMEIRDRLYDDFFERTNVLMDGFSQGVDIDDEIGHDLSGVVECDISSPVRVADLDPLFAKERLGDQHVAFVAPPAQGDDGRMVEKQDGIADEALAARLLESFLQAIRVAVINGAQMIRATETAPAASRFADTTESY